MSEINPTHGGQKSKGGQAPNTPEAEAAHQKQFEQYQKEQDNNTALKSHSQPTTDTVQINKQPKKKTIKQQFQNFLNSIGIRQRINQ